MTSIEEDKRGRTGCEEAIVVQFWTCRIWICIRLPNGNFPFGWKSKMHPVAMGILTVCGPLGRTELWRLLEHSEDLYYARLTQTGKCGHLWVTCSVAMFLPCCWFRGEAHLTYSLRLSVSGYNILNGKEWVYEEEFLNEPIFSWSLFFPHGLSLL